MFKIDLDTKMVPMLKVFKECAMCIYHFLSYLIKIWPTLPTKKYFSCVEFYKASVEGYFGYLATW